MALADPAQELAPQAALVHVPCGVCGQDQTESYRPGMFLWGEQSFPLVRCKHCDLAYITPRPRMEDHQALVQSAEFYARGYSGGVRERGYFDQRDQWLDQCDSDLDVLENEVGYTGRLLEYGAGGGFFSEAARRRGWHVQPIESLKVPADYAQAQFPLEVYRGNLADAPFPEGSFDVAVMNRSLPYQSEPKQVLESLFFLTRPGGSLLLTVPTYVGSGLHRFLWKFRRWVPERLLGDEVWKLMKLEDNGAAGLPYHLQHFNRRSLAHLLDSTGWQIESSQASLPKPDFLFLRKSPSLRERIVRIGSHAVQGLMRMRALPAAEVRIIAKRPIN